tara:strand:- start:146 stop:868 length:723 start_codon:yes stop_codon:yes gene_type:complete
MTCPKDRQNLEKDTRLRYSICSGQSSIHGETLYEIETQEAQSFAFHASTGQGASEEGPGTGRAVLHTPGSSIEILGEGLKTREPGDMSQLPAKIIRCQKGDIILEASDGNILLRGRNVLIDANGGGQDGQFVAKATRVAELDAPDIRLQGEKIALRSTKDISIVSQAFMELSYGFAMASSFGDVNFGAISKIAQQAITRVDPSLNDPETTDPSVIPTAPATELEQGISNIATAPGGLDSL